MKIAFAQEKSPSEPVPQVPDTIYSKICKIWEAKSVRKKCMTEYLQSNYVVIRFYRPGFELDEKKAELETELEHYFNDAYDHCRSIRFFCNSVRCPNGDCPP